MCAVRSPGPRPCGILNPGSAFTSTDSPGDRRADLMFLLSLPGRDAQPVNAIDCSVLAESLQLEHLTGFDFAVRIGGIGKTPAPFDRLLARLHLDDRVTGDELLLFG